LAASDVEAAVAEAIDDLLPGFVPSDGSWRNVGTGYAIRYQSGRGQVFLTANPLSGPIDLETINPVQSDEAGDFVLTHTFDNEPWDLWWVDHGFLIRLIG
ncbi:MAG TPA: hypothetical protein PLV68_15995, partial [Ilumatobacteraceae bacterium]|nr:hypothetical protein [Ilumatobacteraceae bacterium]